jgi:hypothetical protein
MFRLTRSRAATILTLSAGVLISTAAGATGATAGRRTTGIAYVAVTHQVGKILYAAGNTSQTLVGKGAVTYKIQAGLGNKPGTLKVKATVTVFAATGSLSGVVKGIETTASNGSVTFAGTLDLNHGRGGQAGHSLVGTVTGTGQSATGPFVFHDKGIYR